jgi:hypothetical protein
MPPKTEDLGPDLFLETSDQGCSYDHHRYTDRYGSDSNSDNQPGKSFLLGKSYPSGYKMCNIHSRGKMNAKISNLRRIFSNDNYEHEFFGRAEVAWHVARYHSRS